MYSITTVYVIALYLLIFFQDRVTDHRANITVNGVSRVMDGITLDTLLDGLIVADEQQRIKSFLENIENSSAKYRK